MSTILKALRRLEEEKTRDGSPRPLREEVASGPGDHGGRRWTSLLPVLALVVGAGIGASAWWLWPVQLERAVEETAAPVAPSAAVTSDPPQPVAAAPEMPRIVLPDPAAPPALPADAEAALREMAADVEAAPGPPVDAFASDVEVVERPTPTPRIEPVAPPPPPAPQVAAAEPAPAPRVQTAAAGTQRAAGERRPERTQARLEPKVRAVEPAPVAAPKPSAPERTASAPAPVAPPDPVAVPAPDVYVTRTQWHPEHARRSAEVQVAGENRSVREGDVVGEYVVNEIKPSGVVLTRDGERIEQKIGKPPKEARSEP